MNSKSPKLNIIIAGSGAFGTALATVYNDMHNVQIYTRDKHKTKQGLKFIAEITDIPDKCFVFVVTPAAVVREFLASIKDKVKPDTVIILASKGIEQHTNLLMSEVAHEILPAANIAVLSGPNFANELMENLPAISSLSSGQDYCQILSTPNFKLYHCQDIIGVQLYGALKNVLAILCGIVSGLKLGENFKAAALNKGIKEISKIVLAKGGREDTIFEPAAIGDLFLTCNSTSSRNMKLGTLIAKAGYYSKELTPDHVEGVFTIIALQNIIKNLELELPLLRFICSIIADGTKIEVNNLKTVIL